MAMLIIIILQIERETRIIPIVHTVYSRMGRILLDDLVYYGISTHSTIKVFLSN